MSLSTSGVKRACQVTAGGAARSPGAAPTSAWLARRDLRGDRRGDRGASPERGRHWVIAQDSPKCPRRAEGVRQGEVGGSHRAERAHSWLESDLEHHDKASEGSAYRRQSFLFFIAASSRTVSRPTQTCVLSERDGPSNTGLEESDDGIWPTHFKNASLTTFDERDSIAPRDTQSVTYVRRVRLADAVAGAGELGQPRSHHYRTIPSWLRSGAASPSLGHAPPFADAAG